MIPRSSRPVSALTLVEVLITLGIFAVVAVMASIAIINTLKTSKRIQTQAFLYTEANALMNQLTEAVSANTIDYEFYYTQIRGGSGWDTPNYGIYGQTFLDPGTGGPYSGSIYPGVNGYGAYCSDGIGTYPTDCPDDTPLSGQLDTDTGSHPFTGVSEYSTITSEDPASMNAFCEDPTGTGDCDRIQYAIQSQLVLINSSGDERLVFRLIKNSDYPSDSQLGKMQLLGTDSDNNGIVDEWTCSPYFLCASDTPIGADFKAISPGSIKIDRFIVLISPLEDPYRAFSESDYSVQIQPQVTLLLTVSLAGNYSMGLLGPSPSITLQRTISSGVYQEIVSYE